MLYRELERDKSRYPHLADLLTALEAYLDEVLHRSVPNAGGYDHAAFDVVPILVAKGLGIDENLALVLLNRAEEGGVLVRQYHVYCPITDGYIQAFNSEDNLPHTIECPFEDRTEHSIDEYFVELVFNFSHTILGERDFAVSM